MLPCQIFSYFLQTVDLNVPILALKDTFPVGISSTLSHYCAGTPTWSSEHSTYIPGSFHLLQLLSSVDSVEAYVAQCLLSLANVEACEYLYKSTFP